MSYVVSSVSLCSGRMLIIYRSLRRRGWSKALRVGILKPTANFPKWAGPKVFPATPFQVNTPSSLRLCFSFMCILLHVEEQYGSRKKGFGPNNAVWLEMLSLCRFGIKINFSGRGLLVPVAH